MNGRLAPKQRVPVAARLLPLGPMMAVSALAVGTGACGLREYGTSGTSVVVTNTCSDPIIARLKGETWDRSSLDQLRGELAQVGATVDATAINPPDKDEELVLRLSPPSGEPMLVVQIERDRDLVLSLDSTACLFALGRGDGTCDPAIEGDQDLAIVCR